MRSDGIHTAAIEDAEALADLHRRSSLIHEDTREVLLGRPDLFGVSPQTLSRGDVRAVLKSGRIVAFATLVAAGDDVAELEDLFVDPDFMRQGLGRSLVEDAAMRARTQGFDRIEVSANPKALRFYQSVGFIGAEEVRLEFGYGWRLSLDVGRARTT